MKLISFNVNGIRASVKKGLHDTIRSLHADILCLQEIKATPGQVRAALEGLEGYKVIVNSAERPGYSGTAILTREEPVRVDLGINEAAHDTEGRVITAVYPGFTVVNAYIPNSGEGLKRLGYRKQWDEALRNYLRSLTARGNVIFCGDLNVAHRPIDIARPKANYNKTAGYTQTEIDGIAALLAEGFVDSFRSLNPEVVRYSWWSQRFGARAKNIGWRIDYVLVSRAFAPRVKNAFILTEVQGSDHCPVGIEW